MKLLEWLGQHKTARRLKYGHMAWAIQNSSKTDRHLFFGSRNLQALESYLDMSDAGGLPMLIALLQAAQHCSAHMFTKMA